MGGGVFFPIRNARILVGYILSVAVEAFYQKIDKPSHTHTQYIDRHFEIVRLRLGGMIVKVKNYFFRSSHPDHPKTSWKLYKRILVCVCVQTQAIGNFMVCWGGGRRLGSYCD